MSAQRRIVSAWKTGGYGTTMWHHELECGHVFSRKKRIPPGSVAGWCEDCVEDEAGRSRIRELPDAETPETRSHAPETAEMAEPDGLATQLEAVAMAGAVVAMGLRVPREQVEIHVDDDGSVAGGTVILTPSDIERMLRGLTN